jgi:2-phosphosulfolactate phosphatase
MPALKASLINFSGAMTRPLFCDATVVIDVLRATTVIACALAHGARDIVPVADVETARRLARSTDGALLGGEQGNVRPAGFDLGNSPAEYDSRVADRTVILRTTNGTRAIEACRSSRTLWCGALVNASAIVRALAAAEIKTAALVCAGQDGAFSLEDFVCAGAFLDGLTALREIASGDEAIAAQELFRSYRRRLGKLLAKADHARVLQRAGFGDDVAFAAQIDLYDVLPAMREGRIVAS